MSLLFLLGCPRPIEIIPAPAAEPRVIVTPAPPSSDVPSLNAVLGSAGWALSLPRERQAEEVERWSESVARDDLPTDRLRLALLLALGDDQVRDHDRVRALLQSQWYEGESLAAETLARVILEVVETRDEAARQRLRLALQVEEERKARGEAEAALDAIQDIEVEMEARDRPDEEL